ncbi:MAG: thiamine phosphate synthase [Verrucomicrobia bacterium]|nr:thiamine phosphate synthase [Verrucomicrobiota bacterium]
MKSIDQCHLYGILDAGYTSPADFPRVARLMVEGDGIDILQLRAKGASLEDVKRWADAVHAITIEAGVPLVINDHPAVAAAVGAEIIHVGQDDMPLAEVRKLVPQNTLIGKSTHSIDQAMAAAAEGADYIGFGPLFATLTKPDYIPIGIDDILTLHQRLSIPIFCIGGIKKENLLSVLSAGAKRVVIVSGILQAEDVPAYVRDCKRILTT